jgi:hypothetical protein
MYFLLIGLWLGNLTERDRLEDLDLNGRVKRVWGGLDLIGMAEARE